MRLLVVDGNAILHRAFHAMPEWRNRSGEATSGVYGFFSMLIKIKQDLKPDYLAVAFDAPEPNFRHGLYVGYQSNRGRDEQLEKDIWEQVDKLKQVLEKLGVPVYQTGGYEADDIVGTLCEKALNGKEKTEVVVLTGDRDLLQLVNDRVGVYMPSKGISEGKLLDRNGVRQKLGVWPEQVVDYKALMGDGSDGYPGVAGIGPKTAVGLLEKYSDLEGVYKAVVGGGVAGKGMSEGVRMKLAQGQEMAMMSRKLAEIVRDVPVAFEMEKAKMPSESQLGEAFEGLGYKSLVARVAGFRKGKEEKKKKDKANEQQTSLF